EGDLDRHDPSIPGACRERTTTRLRIAARLGPCSIEHAGRQALGCDAEKFLTPSPERGHTMGLKRRSAGSPRTKPVACGQPDGFEWRSGTGVSGTPAHSITACAPELVRAGAGYHFRLP